MPHSPGMQKPFVLLFTLLVATSATPLAHSQEPATASTGPFASLTADIGIVASDLEKSAEFYTEALGLTEIKGFTATPEKATAFGLTDHLGAAIRVFVPGDEPGATRLKLMSFPTATSAKPDKHFIHSTIGISYLTFRVTDMDATLKRLAEAKVKLLGETPANLSENVFLVTVKDPDGNFIELIGPMK